MRLLLVSHGYPPETTGGTERSVQALARGAALLGHEVCVLAGSLHKGRAGELVREEDHEPTSGARIEVLRAKRGDLYFDHWQKSACPALGRAYDGLLAEYAPDVVHVHHWLRLTRDLVTRAARAGVPALVSLHDLWASCLITFRVRPDTKQPCHEPLAASPCLACAGALPPRTPWVGALNGRLLLEQRKTAIARELELARRVIVPSRAHGAALERYLGLELQAEVVAPAPAPSYPAAPAPPDPGPGQPLELGAWGHLVPLKGLDVVLEALRRLPDPSRVRLHVAGGESDATFAAYVHELAQGLDVQFHGAYQAEELATHPVAAVHAMVSGTRAQESHGIVLDEALALGVPVVLPRAGAFAERLAGADWGLGYDSADSDSLSALLASLLENPARLRALREAAVSARSTSTLTDPVARQLELLAEVAAQGAPEAPEVEWWAEGVLERELEAWDEALSQCSSDELGLE